MYQVETQIHSVEQALQGFPQLEQQFQLNPQDHLAIVLVEGELAGAQVISQTAPAQKQLHSPWVDGEFAGLGLKQVLLAALEQWAFAQSTQEVSILASNQESNWLALLIEQGYLIEAVTANKGGALDNQLTLSKTLN
ncbi:GNAT family N-acetyltransferase [Paraferrimonas sedimenticola]|uniref:N-acetyltransferase domain-containing protein n=1 Tax=Paraferrimonas sedimenticola TaxID=375674 RepID=A0AA37RZ63_9GAMM|nr:GNAT family N-acetyltransferase [Paraferrimonas sedimenticola]GLP97562.1 hypothetical protein GCM10007895_28690 [Paraferrimonas sedimenticola]